MNKRKKPTDVISMPPLRGLSPHSLVLARSHREMNGGTTAGPRTAFLRRYVPELTLTTCQGIGDIFWTYQKFYPYVGKININIAVTVLDDVVQRRSFSFLSTWPRIGHVHLKKVPGETYEAIAKTKYKMRDVMDLGLNFADHCSNRWLEEGVRLEQIDPQFPPAWGIPLQLSNPQLELSKYICFYICGSKPDFVWSVEQWIDCIHRLYEKYKLKQPLVVIGAGYDKKKSLAVVEGLNKKIETHVKIDLPPTQVHHVLKNADFFLGYQSGLNVLADNFGTPQLMIYFPYLKPMLYTWCQPHHLKNRLFNADTFDQSPKHVVDNLQFNIHSS